MNAIMTTDLSTRGLIERYAVSNELAPLAKEQQIWNAGVTAFHVLTAALVASAAIAYFKFSLHFLVLSFVIGLVRNAMMNQLDSTGLQLPNEVFPDGQQVDVRTLRKVVNLNPNARRNEIAQFLGITSRDWKPALHLGNFRFYMMQVPVEREV